MGTMYRWSLQVIRRKGHQATTASDISHPNKISVAYHKGITAATRTTTSTWIQLWGQAHPLAQPWVPPLVQS